MATWPAAGAETGAEVGAVVGVPPDGDPPVATVVEVAPAPVACCWEWGAVVAELDDPEKAGGGRL